MSTTPALGWSQDAELSVIGSVLIDRSAVDRIGPDLQPEHFFLPANQKIYDVMLSLWAKKTPPDIISVYHELQQRGHENECTAAYLASTATIVPTSFNAPYYGKIVLQMARQRRIDEAQRRISEAHADDLPDLVNELEDAISDAHDISPFESLEAGMTQMNDDLDRIKSGAEIGVKSGFRALDALMGPWEPGDLIILAARSSHGKTALCLNITYHLVKRNKRVAFFSMEMSAKQIAQRMVALATELDVARIRDGHLNDYEMGRYADAQGPLAALPLRLDARDIPSLRDMRRKLTIEHRVRPFDLIVVDLLGTVRAERGENRTQEISKISGGLKEMARYFETPILATSQLNRQVDARENHEPVLADIRDSGTVEQDANMVLLLHREEKYNPETQRKGVADVIVAKNRQGDTGKIELMFTGPSMRFTDTETRYGSAAQ